MRIPARAALAALATCVLHASSVHAMCDGDAFDFAPRDGVEVPPDPSLLLVSLDGLSLADADLKVHVDGVPAPYTATPIANGWLIRVETGAGRELSVRGYSTGSHTYPIDREWRAAPSQIAGAARVLDHWSCSFTDVIRVAATTRALGLRLAWGGPEPGAAVIAADDYPVAMFVDGAEGPEPVTPDRHRSFDIGHESCRPWNVPQSVYEAGATVTLSALHADGSVEPLGDIALRATAETPPFSRITDLGEVPAPFVPAHEPPTITATVLAALAATFGTLVGSLLGLVAARRRPRTVLFTGTALAVTGLALDAATASIEMALLLAACAGAIAAALVWRLVRHP